MDGTAGHRPPSRLIEDYVGSAEAYLSLLQHTVPNLSAIRRAPDMRKAAKAYADEVNAAREGCGRQKAQLRSGWRLCAELVPKLPSLSPNGSLPPDMPPVIERFFDAFDEYEASLKRTTQALIAPADVARAMTDRVGVAGEAYGHSREALLAYSRELAAGAAEVFSALGQYGAPQRWALGGSGTVAPFPTSG